MSKFIDLSSQKFGKLTVVSRAENDKNGKARWYCECDCGGNTIVCAGSLKKGNTTSCGCNANKLIDLTCQKYGKLTVISRDDTYRSGGARWRCECECGNTTIVRANNLKNGTTTSCGCKQIKHGRYDSREYGIWRNMVQRCTNENNVGYYGYGGRGITVCDRWLNFENFYEDMGERTGEEYSIERIDNNKGYSKENCRWATPIEQANNKRNTIYITFRGETKTITEWANTLGIKRYILKNRLITHGWSVERTLTTTASSRDRGA